MTEQSLVQSPVRFGLVGRGWRAEFFRRLAAELPAEVQLVGVVGRTAEAAREIEASWGTPAHTSIADLVARESPEFVVTSVPWEVAPGAITELVEAGVRVLTETPPAPDADGLRALWQRVGAADAVQVAEQYLMMPLHAARREVVRRGLIGTPTSVHVSSTHGYHAVSMIRGLVGAGFAPATVRATAFSAPLAQPQNRAGWTGDLTPTDATTTLATLDFGGGRSGLYDFTDNQWHNPLRSRRLLVRGDRGEIDDDRVVQLVDERSIVESSLVRRQTGYDLNLEGYELDHVSLGSDVLYRNPFPGHRWSDEDLAIATVLVQTARWTRGAAPAPYPLAEACQDHLISLAIDEAAATGAPVITGDAPWSR